MNRGRGGFRGGRGGNSRGGGGGGGNFRGGNSFGRGRGGFGRGYDSEPGVLAELGKFAYPCEDDLVCKVSIPKVPYFNAPIFLENRQQIGKIDEIFGNVRDFSVTVKLSEDIKASSFAKDQKIFVDSSKLIPVERFLAPPPRGGRGGRGGSRGGPRGRGGGGRGGNFRGGNRGGGGGGFRGRGGYGGSAPKRMRYH